MRNTKPPDAMLTHDDILHLCGELPDWKVARILTSEATYEDLKTAMEWAGGQDDVVGPAEHPLVGRAAYLYVLPRTRTFGVKIAEFEHQTLGPCSIPARPVSRAVH